MLLINLKYLLVHLCAGVSEKNYDHNCNLIEKDFGTSTFLWILRCLSEHLLNRTLPSDCFWYTLLFYFFWNSCYINHIPLLSGWVIYEPSGIAWLWNNSFALPEKPYFPSPRISWKPQKAQVNIIFPSTFWLKKDLISHRRKVQNKNFSVTSKYYLCINFFGTKKDPISHSQKDQNKTFSVISKYHISINFLAQKYHIFYLQKSQNKNFLVISKHDIPC